MVISSKGRYALRVMVYLAVNHSDDYIPLKEISQKEDLSQKYLETITRMLSKAHLIEAASGHGGGYRLTRNPADYSISEILNLTEVQLFRSYLCGVCRRRGTACERCISPCT